MLLPILIFALVSLILYFFVFIIIYTLNYCNRVFSDQSCNVVCRCLYRGCCYFNMYTVKQIN